MNDTDTVTGVTLVSRNAEAARLVGQCEPKKESNSVVSATGLQEKNYQSQIQRACSSSRNHQNSTERRMEKSDDFFQPNVSNALTKKNKN